MRPIASFYSQDHNGNAKRDNMEEILDKIRAFRDERDWMKFHDPKNLAISIAIEAAELRKLPVPSLALLRANDDN